jgi:phage terminase small subunit
MAGPLKNARHEAFAQAVVQGKSATEAYVKAGYQHSEPNACRLTRNDKVQSRIAELQGDAAARTVVTVESLVERFEKLAVDAQKAKQFAAASTALTAQAKLLGLWIDKRENANTNRNADDPARMTDAEIEARLREFDVRAGRDPDRFKALVDEPKTPKTPKPAPGWTAGPFSPQAGPQAAAEQPKPQEAAHRGPLEGFRVVGGRREP